MFATSDATDKLDAALAKAQAEVSAASKDKTNPHFKSKYADLASIWEACRDALTKHGVNATQWPLHSEDGRLHVLTRLAHGGQWMRGHFSIPVGKQDAQGYGSAITYAKRFALAAAVGVVADDDDDGNGAVKGNGKHSGADERMKAAGLGGLDQEVRDDAWREWATGDEAKKWLAGAKQTIPMLQTPDDIIRWRKASAKQAIALQDYHPERSAFLEKLLSAAADRVGAMAA